MFSRNRRILSTSAVLSLVYGKSVTFRESFVPAVIRRNVLARNLPTVSFDLRGRVREKGVTMWRGAALCAAVSFCSATTFGVTLIPSVKGRRNIRFGR